MKLSQCLRFSVLYAAAGVTFAQSNKCLYNSDFKDGTLIIDQPGSYKLCEDIIFCPSNGINFAKATDTEIAKAFDPYDLGKTKYMKNEFALGFFAAISVTADDVTISLNGKSLSQCREHALLQRFFALIELASSPFLPNVGPHNFVSSVFKAAKNFKLVGPGVMGLSSHHSIHGNENENVQISGVTFKNFEVGAVSLNNVKGLEIKNCDIPNNRQDLPVLGLFSAALNIRSYLDKIMKSSEGQSLSLTIGGTNFTVNDIYSALVKHIGNVFRDVMNTGSINPTHVEEYFLYNNPNRVIDGPCYAFLVHGRGPAVGGFGNVQSTDVSALSTDVSILNNNIANIKCFTNEVLASVVNGVVQNDARGSVLQFYHGQNNKFIGMIESKDAQGTVTHVYTGNAVLNAQLITAKAIITTSIFKDDPRNQINVNTIGFPLLDWAQGTNPTFVHKFRCNGDSMHHVIKGSIMIRVDDTQGFDIQGNTINNVEVLSKSPVELCADFHVGASVADGSDRMLADIRGISVASSSAYADKNIKDSFVSHNTIANFKSPSAHFIDGIDIQGYSEGITITNNYVNLDPAVGDIPNDKWVGLRIRDSAQGIFTKSNNIFVQGEVQESRRRQLPEYHPRSLEETEWPNNGCPYGH